MCDKKKLKRVDEYSLWSLATCLPATAANKMNEINSAMTWTHRHHSHHSHWRRMRVGVHFLSLLFSLGLFIVVRCHCRCSRVVHTVVGIAFDFVCLQTTFVPSTYVSRACLTACSLVWGSLTFALHRNVYVIYNGVNIHTSVRTSSASLPPRTVPTWMVVLMLMAPNDAVAHELCAVDTRDIKRQKLFAISFFFLLLLSFSLLRRNGASSSKWKRERPTVLKTHTFTHIGLNELFTWPETLYASYFYLNCDENEARIKRIEKTIYHFVQF